MVRLQVMEVLGQSCVVQDVVCHIVHDVAQSSTGKRRASDVVRKNGENQSVEGVSQHDKQGWRHHQSVFVHGQVVVHAVQKKVDGEENPVVRQVAVQVEQEPVHAILNKRPYKQAKRPETQGGDFALARKPNRKNVEVHRKPHDRNDPPWSQRNGLQEIAKQRRRALAVVARAMHLVQVEVLVEGAREHLGKQRLVQVQELVLLVVVGKVCLDRQLFQCWQLVMELVQVHLFLCLLGELHLHRSLVSVVQKISFLFRSGQVSDQHVVFKHLVRALGVLVGLCVAHDLCDVLAGVLQNQIISARMLIEKFRDIVHFSVVQRDPAVLRRVVFGEIRLGQKRQRFGHGGSKSEKKSVARKKRRL